MRRAVSMAVTGVLVGALGGVRTAQASPSARLLYARSVDAATCPDEAALRKAVAARVGYDPFFPWAAEAVIVQVWRVPHGFAARVQAVDEHGLALGTRELSSDGESCAELFDATALAISIALDAAAAPSPSGPSAPPPPDPDPPSALPVPLAPAPPMVEAPPPPLKDNAAENGLRRPSKYWSAGTDVIGGVGVAPSPNAGIEAFIGRRVKAFSLEVGLRADLSFPKPVFADANTPLGRVQSARFALIVAPCVHLSVAYACPLAEVGWFQAWISSGGSNPQSPGGALLAGGARVGVDLPVTPSFDVRIYADGVANLDRPVFRIDQMDAWVEPPFAAAAGVGVATVIP